MRLTLFIKTIFICFVIVPLTSIGQTQKSNQKLFNTKKLKEHVVTLASDSFQGRKPFTTGETKTITYLTNELKTIGVEPGNGESYLQEVMFAQTRTANIIAKITGSEYPDETIIYSAHWDHLGIGQPDKKGDSIYNGANDDALGVAVVLELAQAFKNCKTRPARTIVFVFFTGEETGMLGSRWYIQHPVYPLTKTVADFNIDGFNRYGRTKDIEVNGAWNSTLEDNLAKEVKKQGRYMTTGDPKDNLYFRSDQISFAKAGVPALFFGRGTDYLNGGKAYEKVVREKYWAYHTPNDEFNKGWRFDGTIEDMELLFNLGKTLANNRVWPQWKPLSEFKSIRDKYLKTSK
jgi:Zn-dependent M28 family amino/carboxypeptidase